MCWDGKFHESRAGIEAVNFRALSNVLALAILLGSVGLVGYILGISTLISSCPPILDYLKIALEFISSIAWPAAVVGVALLFKKDIQDAIPRVEHAGPGGVTLRQAAQESEPPKVQANEQEKPLDSANFRPEVKKAYDTILAKLDKDRPTDVRGHLAYYLAESQLATYFENTYGQIFGSQLRGLRALDGQGAVTVEDAESFYKREAAEKYPNEYKNFTFDQWLGFLEKRELVQRKDSRVEITNLGREFMTYMRAKRLSENKSL